MLVVRTRQLTTEDFHLIRRAALSAAPTTRLVDTACQTINLATSCRNDKLSGPVYDDPRPRTTRHADWPACAGILARSAGMVRAAAPRRAHRKAPQSRRPH